MQKSYWIKGNEVGQIIKSSNLQFSSENEYDEYYKNSKTNSNSINEQLKQDLNPQAANNQKETKPKPSNEKARKKAPKDKEEKENNNDNKIHNSNSNSHNKEKKSDNESVDKNSNCNSGNMNSNSKSNKNKNYGKSQTLTNLKNNKENKKIYLEEDINDIIQSIEKIEKN